MPKSGNAKKKCWKLFSQNIRQRYSDRDGNCVCVTCGSKRHWKEMHAGHFVDSRNNTILLDERLVYPQCPNCNVYLHGNKINYFRFMRSLGYSEEELYAFQQLKFATRKMTEKDWEAEYVLLTKKQPK